MPSKRRQLLFSLLLVLAAESGLAGNGHDHDRARQALEAGEVLPLRAILERVEREHPGQVMEVELEREEGRWIYRVRLLRSGGALIRLKVDARDGTLIGSRPHKPREEVR